MGQAVLDQLEQQDLLVRSGLKVLWGSRDHRDVQVPRGNKDLREIKVRLVHRGSQVPWEPLVHLEIQEYLDRLGSQGRRGPPVPLDLLELLEQLEHLEEAEQSE